MWVPLTVPQGLVNLNQLILQTVTNGLLNFNSNTFIPQTVTNELINFDMLMLQKLS